MCAEGTVNINLRMTWGLRQGIPKISTNLWYWVATGLGLGLSPVAPGTVGALLGLLFAYPVQHLSGLSFWTAYLIGGIALIFVGVVSSTWLCRFLGAKDPSAAVIDEITAQFLVTALVPAAAWSILLSLFLSRFFDIVKFFPCRQAEELPEGWGIMADDLMAAVYALATYKLLAAGIAIFRA